MSWYIVVTNPNCHRRAETGLAAIGYQAFWPKYRKWASHARVKVAKEYPVLGRYLFVEVPDGNFWGVRAVHGIEGFLTGEDGAPAEVHERIVWDFRGRYMRGEWDFVALETGEFMDSKTGEITTRCNEVPIGARVRIMEGEFADLLVIVRGRNRNDKLKFLPPGRTQFVHTAESNVRAA